MADTRAIYLVDDDPTVGMLLRAALPSYGDDLTLAGTAGDAATALREVPLAACNVVVVDHELPDGNGIDLGRDLRVERPDVRLVLWTGHRSHTVRRRAEIAGFAGVVSKSGDLGPLVDAIRGLDETSPGAVRSDATNG